MGIIPEETPVGIQVFWRGWRCNTVIYEDISAISTDNVMTYTKIRKVREMKTCVSRPE